MPGVLGNHVFKRRRPWGVKQNQMPITRTSLSTSNINSNLLGKPLTMSREKRLAEAVGKDYG